MATRADYERWHRFLPYGVWSRKIINFWNGAVGVKSRIRSMTSSRATELQNELKDAINDIRLDTEIMCSAVRRTDWIATSIDVLEITRAESRTWLEYFVSEDMSFETVCANIGFVLDDAIEELEAKLLSTIFGSVVDAETRLMLVGAVVEVDGLEATVETTGYRIEDIPRGTYDVTASFEDYPEETQTVELPPNTELEVNFELSKKNKIVALHMRWFYDSKRGSGHDISIEGIATVVIPASKNKEDYEDELKTALRDRLLATEGFERLEDALKEEVLGFEEQPTDQRERGIEVEEVEWEHKIGATQLSIGDFLR